MPHHRHKKATDSEEKQNNICVPDNTKQAPVSIEEWEELQVKSDLDALDTRKRPDYKVSYKQDVKTEDVFLQVKYCGGIQISYFETTQIFVLFFVSQLSNKSTATSSCDEMIIQITMPDETVTIDGMKLSASRNDIDLETPVYRLKLPLMQPINPDLGKASWDNEKKILTLRLKMDREFDYVNF